MANKLLSSVFDQRSISQNNCEPQRSTVILEAGRVPQNDTISYTFGSSTDGMNSEDMHRRPPVSVEVFTHNGGLLNTVDDNWAVSDGDTILFEVNDPEDETYRDITKPKNTWWYAFTHTLDGVTGGAATNAEVVASLMADETFTRWAYAVADTTANRVKIYPKGLEGKIRITGGTAQAVLLFPTSVADNRLRTFTYKPIVAADWSWTYNGDTKTFALTRANATAATDVHVVVRQF